VPAAAVLPPAPTRMPVVLPPVPGVRSVRAETGGASAGFADQLPVAVSLDAELAVGAVPPVLESAAYFIVAEGLSNALKHAGAGYLAVRIRHRNELLVVEVTDDGVGGASLSAGSGLRGLADRAEVLGGTLRVISPVGHGTRLVAELPCGS